MTERARQQAAPETRPSIGRAAWCAVSVGQATGQKGAEQQ